MLWPKVGRDAVHCGQEDIMVAGGSVAMAAYDSLFRVGESGSKDLKENWSQG